MKSNSIILILLLMIDVAACSKDRLDRESLDSNYARVSQSDESMNAAIVKAKTTLPQFIEALHHAKPSYRDFAVKKPYATPNGSEEHMWIANLKESNGVFEGTINNDAYDTRLVKYGDTVRFPIDQISDWKYIDGESLVGGFTIRYFFDRMSPEEKKALEEEGGYKIR